MSRSLSPNSDLFGPTTNATASSSRGVTPTRLSLKRNAESANLSEASPAHPLRRSLIKTQINNTSLEAKVFALEQKLRQRDEELESKRVETSQLMQHRRDLNNGYEAAMSARDKALSDLYTEKTRYSQAIERSNQSRSELEDVTVQLRNELSSLGRKYSQQVSQSQKDYDILQSQLTNVEEERDSLAHMRKQAHDLSEALERKERELDDVRSVLAAERERATSSGGTGQMAEGENSLRDELKRQAGMLATMGKNQRTLQMENAELRLRRDNVEAATAEMKTLSKRAKNAEDKLVVCQKALDRARKDMDMLTISIPSNTSTEDSTMSTTDYTSLQYRLTQLSAAHSLCGQTIAAKQSTILDYSNKLEQISRETMAELDKLQHRAEVSERELRWANESRISAEKRLALAREELEVLRARYPNNAASEDLEGASCEQIHVLEAQVALYRRAIDSYQQGTEDGQTLFVPGGDLVKRTDLEAAQAQNESIRQEMETLQKTIAANEESYEELRKEAEDMEARLGSGEYNTKIWRAIEFSGSPAAKDFAIRKETLEKLKAENEALLGKVNELQASGVKTIGGVEGSSIPVEVYDRLKEEKAAEAALHEKRLSRLRDAFSLRSREFLEAVQSLLGWRVKFDENGRDVKLESMYAPRSGKMGLRLVFKSEGGHFGTMQMMGGLGKNLEHVKEYWVLQRESIPGFLAQVTLEAFEKTTMGRLAGYAANDEVEET